jgi:hypothetical protein
VAHLSLDLRYRDRRFPWRQPSAASSTLVTTHRLIITPYQPEKQTRICPTPELNITIDCDWCGGKINPNRRGDRGYSPGTRPRCDVRSWKRRVQDIRDQHLEICQSHLSRMCSRATWDCPSSLTINTFSTSPPCLLRFLNQRIHVLLRIDKRNYQMEAGADRGPFRYFNNTSCCYQISVSSVRASAEDAGKLPLTGST